MDVFYNAWAFTCRCIYDDITNFLCWKYKHNKLYQWTNRRDDCWSNYSLN